MSIDLSERATETMEKLSSVNLENAELKRTIALTEAQNAELVIENEDLKAKLEHFGGNESLVSAEKHD